jgi:hypothetical protein
MQSPPRRVEISPRDLRPILNRLTGLRLVGKAAWIQTNVHRDKGMMVVSLALLPNPASQKQLKTHLGKPLTMAAMKEIKVEVEQWYRAQGRPFVNVVFPPQDISTGLW